MLASSIYVFSPLVILVIAAPLVRCWPAPADPYMSESWAMLNNGRMQHQQSCVDIPRNFSLCYGIDYPQMRLPNLLEHETLDEAVQQAAPWKPLLQINCHPDTQLFLCSLFAPVCLERAINPCRSLCEAVKSGCEKRMEMYGFPWPEMLNCNKFPVSHDMCIQPRENYQVNQSCPSCSQVGTYENLLDHFCRSEYVLRVKLQDINNDHVVVKRGRKLKPRDAAGNAANENALRGMKLQFAHDNQSCPCSTAREHRQKRFLAMANRGVGARADSYVLNLILPWKKEKEFKRALRMFRKLDCKSLGTEIRDRARRERSGRLRKTQKNAHHWVSPFDDI